MVDFFSVNVCCSAVSLAYIRKKRFTWLFYWLQTSTVHPCTRLKLFFNVRSWSSFHSNFFNFLVLFFYFNFIVHYASWLTYFGDLIIRYRLSSTTKCIHGHDQANSSFIAFYTNGYCLEMYNTYRIKPITGSCFSEHKPFPLKGILHP